MKKFLVKLAIAVGLATVVHVIAAYCATGVSDPYYLRYTAPRTHSMIIGTSRGAQGVVPERLDGTQQEFGWEGPVYNFAFTRLASPFGETYFKAIREKLDASTTNGFFIITVEPVSIADDVTDPSSALRDREQILSKVRSFSSTPNYDYLLRHYDKGWGHLIADPYLVHDPKLKLHQRGWLEVNVPMDSISIAGRAKSKLRANRSLIGKFKTSAERVQWMKETMRFLKDHGEVYIVRLPISTEMYEIEQEMTPEFDSLMTALSGEFGAPYFDMNSLHIPIQTTDGHHLGRESALICTDSIAQWIRKLR